MVRYRSHRPADTEVRARLRELPNERRRFDYRRPFILLRRDGEPSGIDRIYWLDREDGLMVCKCKGRRKALGRGLPSWSRPRRRPAGRWTLFTISWPMAGASAFSTSSMT